MDRPELIPAIRALEEEVAALERQAAELRGTVNLLCQRAGLPPRYAETEGTPQTSAATQIKPDSFYGKKMQTAAREFLEMRRKSDGGPAKPREIFDALQTGGFQFETKDETIALVSLRAMLRKNSATFHKLPNGQYGLKLWYPNAKPSKEDSDAGEISTSIAKSAPGRTGKRPAKPAMAKKPKGTRKGNPTIAPFIADAMQDGSDWTTKRLRREAVARGIPDVDQSTKLSAFHAALLGLKSRGLVRLVDKGVWRAVKADATDSDTASEPKAGTQMEAAAA